MPQGSYQNHLCSQLQKKKIKLNYVITLSQCAFFMPRLFLSAVCGAALFEECNNGETEPFHLQGSVSPSGSVVCSQSNFFYESCRASDSEKCAPVSVSSLLSLFTTLSVVNSLTNTFNQLERCARTRRINTFNLFYWGLLFSVFRGKTLFTCPPCPLYPYFMCI